MALREVVRLRPVLVDVVQLPAVLVELAEVAWLGGTMSPSRVIRLHSPGVNGFGFDWPPPATVLVAGGGCCGNQVLSSAPVRVTDQMTQTARPIMSSDQIG